MESGYKTRSEHFHCPDCDLTVHENDKDNHLNGARHNLRIRLRKNPQNVEAQPQFLCDICDTTFTNRHFYTIHQGSKTHKRNLRRLQKRRSSKNSHDLAQSDQDPGFKPTARSVRVCYPSDFCDYKSLREKYRPRNTKNPEGINKTYVSSATAYWAAALALDPSVDDFKISINDKAWSDFGDVVVEIELKATKELPGLTTTFAIQFKDVSNNVKRIDSLAEGRFGLAKYISEVNAIKLQTDVDNKKFIVYTTSHADAKMEKLVRVKSDVIHKMKQECCCDGSDKELTIVSKTLSNRKRLLINTSDDNDNIIFFFCKDKTHSLPRIYLYTHQKKLKHFGKLIDDLVSANFGDDKRIVEIHREFIKYIENWGDGSLGGNYKLKKEDVLVKLAHMLLYSYRLSPRVNRAGKYNNYTIWQRAINTVDVTVLRNHPTITSKVCEPLNLTIEKELNLKIDLSTSTLTLNQQSIENIHNHVLKTYMFEETLEYDLDDDIPLEIAYDFFWKAGLIPLLLRVEDLKHKEHVLNVLTLFKAFGLVRRYFLMTPAEDHDMKSSLRYYKSLNFFVHLGDVANKLPPFTLDNVKINVTDKFSLSLKAIQQSDSFFLKTITAHEFFDMTLDRYSFKPFGNHLATLRAGEDTQLVLTDDLMAKLHQETDAKDEMQMVLMKYETHETSQCLRGVRPNLFC